MFSLVECVKRLKRRKKNNERSAGGIHAELSFIFFYTLTAFSFLAVLPISYCRAQCWDPSRSYVRAIYPSSGNREIDLLIAKEAPQFNKYLNVVCNIFYIDDGSSYNAYASQNVTDNMVQDGTVYLGEHLLREKLWKMSKAKIAVVALLAHEYAHVLQSKTGYGLKGRQQELHADLITGYYLGKRGLLSSSEIPSFADSLFFLMVSQGFFSTEAHGDAEERKAALIEGFRMRRENFGTAYSQGLLFILKEDAHMVSATDTAAAENKAKRSTLPLYSFCTGLHKIVENAPFHFKMLLEGQQPESSQDIKFWNVPFFIAHTTDAHIQSRSGEPDVPRTALIVIRRSSDRDDVSDAYNAISTGVRNCLLNFSFDGEVFDSSQASMFRQSFSGYDHENGVKVSVVFSNILDNPIKESTVYECDIFVEEYLK
ncbi:MAG TPA: hypothetical protein VEW28_04735 [Candidatus Kapabacteria bacterium]|nr:hypothetical protein [Candidatus Kapabacteria bacterium]